MLMQFTQFACGVDQPHKHQKVEQSPQQPINENVVEVLEESPLLQVVARRKQHRREQPVEDYVLIEGDLLQHRLTTLEKYDGAWRVRWQPGTAPDQSESQLLSPLQFRV